MKILLILTLHLISDSCRGKTINAYVGETVNISCRYPESHRSEPKLFCKRLDTGGCNYIGSVNKTGKPETKKNISLYYDKEKENLNVTIRYVTVQDSGEYWCGTTSDWTTDHGLKIYSTQIYLQVVDPASNQADSVYQSLNLANNQ
ncbi:CMRF35-like molecule 9 [Electrophorus electricus]|uniref:CMRF35-like molecule 9 n=1 Tax=Electrophorus electricus TaxID=8005 RepID=UPI0015CFDAB0|nr:CMRF35-like molecule 9 [Electrophorus electricus]XP_035390482.1 CMRF35-like molecule 9 [Electrophorus electricus]